MEVRPYVAIMRSRDERGAVAVEFALVLPILIVLLLGTITTGLSLSNAVAATNAVREGARFGATADATEAAWGANVVDRTQQTQFDDPDEETYVCVQLLRLPATQVLESCGGTPPPETVVVPYPPAPTGVAGGCVVRVRAARPYTINAVFNQWDDWMIDGAVARYERAATC